MKKKTLFSLLLLVLAVLGVNFMWASVNKPHVYINPGHGGHTSNDRNVVVPPFAAGDTSGFWESNSNLKKAFAMRNILWKKGYDVSISRVKNDEEDDLALSTIVALSNASGADVFYSIHSNATGAGDGYRINHPMGLYRGYTGQPEIAGSDSLANCLGGFLLENTSTVWSSKNYIVYGDWTYYPHWGDKVGLGVLRGNRVVSMLNEGSFHDYIPEAYRLINDDYCWVEGWNFTLGADKYFHRLDKYNMGIVTGNIRDDRMLRTASYVMLGDDKRQPVNGAVAKLLDASGNVLQSCQVDSIENGIYLFKDVAPGSYQVEVSEPAHFTQTKPVEVKPNASTYCNFDLKRVRNTPPQVVSYSPVWTPDSADRRCNVPIVLQFNWDMDTKSVEEAFTITPAVQGTFTWEDTNYRVIFTPTDAFDVNTLYTVVLKSTAQHGGGTPMESDFTMSFQTEGRNHIYPLAVFPREGSKVHYKAGQYVEFRTDSLLDAYNLFTRLHVYDKSGAELAINKRATRTNKRGDAYGFVRISLLNALVPGDDYKLVVDQAICDTVGLHLTEAKTYHFTAVDAGAAKDGTVIDDFENKDNYVLALPTASGSPTAKLAQSSDKLFGTGSVQLTYTFDRAHIEAQGYDDAACSIPLEMATAPSAETFVKGDQLGIHINGDMSYNHFMACFEPVNNADAAAHRRWVNLSTVDYHGWTYVTCSLDELDEGITYKLVSYMLKNDSKMGFSGVIKLDNLLKLPTSGINDVAVPNSTVKVAPNPASDYVVASAGSLIQGVELINGNGQVVARQPSNYVNVSDLPDGIYFLKVYVSGAVTTHKVVVKH